MNTAGQSKIRFLISILFSFFTSLFIFIFSLLLIVNATFLNLDFMNKQISKSSYCENALNEVKETFISYGAASSFDADFFDSVLELNQVKLDVYHMALQLYSNGNSQVDTDKFNTDLYNKLTENVKARNIEITPEVDTALQYLAQTCTDTYRQYISLPFITEIAPVLSKLQQPLQIALFIMLGLILFLSVFIFLINRWKHRVVRYYIYSIGGSVLMLLALPLLAILSGKITKVAFMSKSLYYLAVTYMNSFFSLFFGFAIGLSVLLILLLLLYRSMTKNLNR